MDDFSSSFPDIPVRPLMRRKLATRSIGRLPVYTSQEDAALLWHCVNRNEGKSLTGNNLYKRFEELQVLPERSWQSMRARYVKKLMRMPVNRQDRLLKTFQAQHTDYYLEPFLNKTSLPDKDQYGPPAGEFNKVIFRRMKEWVTQVGERFQCNQDLALRFFYEAEGDIAIAEQRLLSTIPPSIAPALSPSDHSNCHVSTSSVSSTADDKSCFQDDLDPTQTDAD